METLLGSLGARDRLSHEGKAQQRSENGAVRGKPHPAAVAHPPGKGSGGQRLAAGWDRQRGVEPAGCADGGRQKRE